MGRYFSILLISLSILWKESKHSLMLEFPEPEKAQNDILDGVDRQLISLLRAAPRGDKRSLAKELGISAPTLSTRLDKLSKLRAGELRLQRDFMSMGYLHIASLEIEIRGENQDAVADHLKEHPQVIAILSFLEAPVLSVQVVVRDPAQLHSFIENELAQTLEIERVHSNLSLKIHRYSNIFAEPGLGQYDPIPSAKTNDEIDLFEEAIFSTFRKNGTISNRQAANLLDTTEHRVRRNLNRLLKTNSAAFNYLVSPKSVGLDLWAFMRIASRPANRAKIIQALLQSPNCVSIVEVAGEWSFFVWAVARNADDLRSLTERVSRDAISVNSRQVHKVHKHNCDYACILPE